MRDNHVIIYIGQLIDVVLIESGNVNIGINDLASAFVLFFFCLQPTALSAGKAGCIAGFILFFTCPHQGRCYLNSNSSTDWIPLPYKVNPSQYLSSIYLSPFNASPFCLLRPIIISMFVKLFYFRAMSD